MVAKTIVLVVSILVFSFPQDAIVLQELRPNFYLWVTPQVEKVDMEVISQLYDLLVEYVEPHASGLIGRRHVIKFVEYADDGGFPETTEGSAGLCGCYCLECDWESEPVFCSSCVEGQNPNVLLAAVSVLEESWQTLGFATHEMAHLFGAVDGSRSPIVYDDHLLTNCHQDTYAIFGLKSIMQDAGFQGVFFRAFESQCAVGDEFCWEIHGILYR